MILPYPPPRPPDKGVPPMPPEAMFVFYLLALIAFTIAAIWPLARREPYTPIHLIALGLALGALVTTWTAGTAAF